MQIPLWPTRLGVALSGFARFSIPLPPCTTESSPMGGERTSLSGVNRKRDLLLYSSSLRLQLPLALRDRLYPSILWMSFFLRDWDLARMRASCSLILLLIDLRMLEPWAPSRLLRCAGEEAPSASSSGSGWIASSRSRSNSKLASAPQRSST